MKSCIQILLLEDNPDDAMLIKRALDRDGLKHTLERIQTREEFINAMDHGGWGIILSDYRLPGFDGHKALAIARERCPEVPFILVTGVLGEDSAIATLARGATDYVLKDRLTRLVPTIQRALREAHERDGRRYAADQLRLSRDRLRALSVYLQTVREEERIRISRAVHDELGQALTGLKIDLAWLGTRLNSKPGVAQDRITEMSARIDETIATVRRIATELRPPILDHLGLAAAIEWQAREFQNRTGVECHVACAVSHVMLDEDITTAFFRIFQEALTNIARHADATSVHVRLEQKHMELVMEIADNGRGITDEQISDIRSLGLLGMKERASLLGGFIVISGDSRKGTSVRVTIPLRNQTPTATTNDENPHCRRSRRGAPRLAPNPRRRVRKN